MGETYGARPSTWLDVADPDLCREYDEAAYEVGTGIARVDGETKQQPHSPPKTPPKPTRTVRKHARADVLRVLGYVPADDPGERPDDPTDETYAQLMGSLDGQQPSA